MARLLSKKYELNKQILIAELENVEHVSTTADCWTSHRRSFLGMTAHWHGEGKNSKDIIRRSACLGVRRVYGSHTYNVLARAMADMHAEFKITSKVNCTITDNGSNFLKAFKMFSLKENEGRPPRGSSNVDNEEEVDDYLDDDDEEDDVVYVDIGEILDSHYNEARLSLEIEERNGATEQLPRSEKEGTLNATLNNEDSDSDNDICNIVAHIHLPRHFRCTCHSLNLIATTDVKNIDQRQFNKLKNNLDKKLSAIWNKQSRSSLASDYIKDKLGELFIIHNATRWNSYYNSLCKVNYFQSKKPEEFNAIMDHFKLKKLTVAEQEFLKEFIKIMKPIADALDVFQNEEKMSVGCVLPVLTVLKEKLVIFKDNRSVIHCVPLVNCLLEGVERRFSSLFTDTNMILAAISDPHFKLSWISEGEKSTAIDLLKKEVDRRTSASVDAHESSLDEASLSDGSPTRKRKRNRFLDGLRKKVTTEIGEVDRFFHETVPGSLKDLDRFPTIKQIFLEYNSALPSSAACERLFSTAGLIFVPKRSNLSDSNFDKLVFLKQNGTCFRNWQLCPSKTS
ncbi:uncharacterized protein LOC116923342 [Daphnia magna]|uniref:uncharacterized protein LOC116923342 n=1 Tax=Daphnia magna TaxID=35525 RepID=UPI001E1BB577|nr:uncharacterized protein LOC116923342 [Daphnia magna]